MFGNNFVFLSKFLQERGDKYSKIELTIQHNYNAELVVELEVKKTKNPWRRNKLNIKGLALYVEKEKDSRYIHDPYIHNVWSDCTYYLVELLGTQGYNKQKLTTYLEQYYIKE